MGANAYRGEEEIALDGERYVLRFDWHAIGSLRTEFGADWPQRLGRAIDETEMEVIAKALEIGLPRRVGTGKLDP